MILTFNTFVEAKALHWKCIVLN